MPLSRKLVPPANPSQLAAAVRDILQGNAAAQGDAGRQYVLAQGNIAAFAGGIGAACERAIASP